MNILTAHPTVCGNEVWCCVHDVLLLFLFFRSFQPRSKSCFGCDSGGIWVPPWGGGILPPPPAPVPLWDCHLCQYPRIQVSVLPGHYAIVTGLVDRYAKCWWSRVHVCISNKCTNQNAIGSVPIHFMHFDPNLFIFSRPSYLIFNIWG